MKINRFEREKRQRIWKHNSFLGHVTMMQKNLEQIIAADSTTELTKRQAARAYDLLPELLILLAERKD